MTGPSTAKLGTAGLTEYDWTEYSGLNTAGLTEYDMTEYGWS